MMGFQKLRLRGKLMVVITTISALVLIITGLALAVYESFRFHHEIIQTTSTKAEIIANQCIAPILFDDNKAASDILASLKSDPKIVCAALFTAAGKRYAVFSKKEISSPKLQRPITTSGHTFSDSLLYVWRPVISNGENIGTLYLCVDLRWHKIQLLQYTSLALIMFLLLVLIALWLSFKAQHIITDPINDIVRVAEDISSGKLDYDAHVPDNARSDELGMLVHSFNSMLDAINTRNKTIEAARRELEQRVRERTMELTAEIKHRRFTEAELRQQRDMAQRYLDMAGIMLVALDREGCVTMLNNKGAALTGYTQDELLGKNWFSIAIPHEGAAEREKTFRQCIQGTIPWQKYDEDPILTKDGRIRMVSWHNTPLTDINDNIIGSLSSCIDITEKNRVEEELRRSQKLESLGTFAGGIAHDFNNFLMIIYGNVELAKYSLDKPDEAKELLDTALQGATRAQGLTKQLITFSKGGAPNKKLTNIKQTIINTATFVTTGSNINPTINIPDNLWPCNVDIGQLEQVIANLTLNAKQAMPDGGQLEISAANVSVDETFDENISNGDYVKITISDTGCGISKHNITRIFDPYFTTKKGGSGLGLAVTYSIIKFHNGHINVESKINAGTTFTIMLPAIPIETEDEKINTTGRLSKSYNILLMEDEVMVGEVIKVMLERMNCSVRVALDGEAAIKLYREARDNKPFDLVILDIIVPNGMGGGEASRRLLELDPDAKLIISSAYSNDPLMSEYAAHGFKACIAKPYTGQELEAVLKSVLEPENG